MSAPWCRPDGTHTVTITSKLHEGVVSTPSCRLEVRGDG
jgi:hypothetical protein